MNARKLLREVDECIEIYTNDENERVSRQVLIDLWARHAADIVGRHLIPLLRRTCPS